MSQEIDALFPSPPVGIGSPPGGIYIRLEGADCADLKLAIAMLTAVQERRRIIEQKAEEPAPATAGQRPDPAPEPEASEESEEET